MRKPTPRKLAEIVRRRAEEYARTSKITDEKTLAGMCAIASYALMRAFYKYGYKSAKLIVFIDECEGHCWVEYRGHVYDVTATQYDRDLPKVTVVRKSHEEYAWHPKSKHTKAVKRPGYFLKVGWQLDECPNRNVTNFFMKVIP